MNLSELGNSIKTLRKEKNITQQQLATLSGISRVTLGKLERGEFGSVSIKTLDIIIDALGYEIDLKVKDNFGLVSLDKL